MLIDTKTQLSQLDNSYEVFGTVEEASALARFLADYGKTSFGVLLLIFKKVHSCYNIAPLNGARFKHPGFSENVKVDNAKQCTEGSCLMQLLGLEKSHISQISH